MPKLIVTKGPMKDKVFFFSGEVVFAGRGSDNDITLEGREISRKHFKFVKKGKRLYVEDLKSRNGTRLNGEGIVPGREFLIKEKDILSIGNSEFHVADLLEKKSSPEKDSSAQEPQIDTGDETKPFKERRSLDRKNLELIWEVTELLRKSMSIKEVLERVMRHIMDSLPRIDTAAIILYDNQKDEMVETFSTERFESVMEEVRFSESIVKRVIKDGKAIRMSNTKYENPEDLSESITELKIKSLMCVPMISNEEIFGAIYVDARGIYGFRKDDLLLLNSVSGPVAVAVEKSMLESRLEDSTAKFEVDF